MKQTVLLDTGPLVSFLLPGLTWHEWAVQEWRQVSPPFLTCESVLTEAAFLLRREKHDADVLFDLLARRIIQLSISIADQKEDIRSLIHRYRNLPMSLADACLVRLSELHRDSVVFTLDSDFRLYRRHGNKVIPVIMP